ncbi:Uncharacterised protein [Corynebacterium kutscheri]|uniref:DNA-binding protein n=1 Tax=Corynebacterium kutscheri TaxID=35755 RepID=A0AB38VT94_9CORY|nr:hypothetical protein [Corynebacterium kutscheri]VEH04363.1 Uncharacterised protein [Corynebacterium kutscheri]VEH80267.1 Uncharacterised protein [Corynebacterium kutscheri]
MNPIFIDRDTGKELWSTQQCADYCDITYNTWSNYHARKRTPPAAVIILNKTPLWFADDIITWKANRPGSPVDNAPRPAKLQGKNSSA